MSILLFMEKEEGDSISDHLLKLRHLRPVVDLCKEVDTEDLVAILLKSLHPSFKNFVETLNVIYESTDITF